MHDESSIDVYGPEGLKIAEHVRLGNVVLTPKKAGADPGDSGGVALARVPAPAPDTWAVVFANLSELLDEQFRHTALERAGLDDSIARLIVEIDVTDELPQGAFDAAIDLGRIRNVDVVTLRVGRIR